MSSKTTMWMKKIGWSKPSVSLVSAVIAAFVGASAISGVHAQEARQAPNNVDEIPTGADGLYSSQEPVLHPGKRSLTLKDLGSDRALRLRGIEHQQDFPVSIRNNEIVTDAKFRLRYSHSPSLIYEWSHLSVLVNDEVMGTVQLTPETVDGGEVLIDIDPRSLVGYSELGVRAVMHYTRDCEDPTHSTLWAVVANDSELQLDVQQIHQTHELALLPEPFFDRRDADELVLPFVLPNNPTAEELAAAGIVASWFGAMAEYRGASFPSKVGSLPESGNAVLIGSRNRLGAAARSVGSGAQIAMADHPTDSEGKLLIVSGDDGAGLIAAARALTLGTHALSGPSTAIREFEEPPVRKPYDAPRWVPTDRPVQIGERISAEQLETRGQYPEPIRIPWDIPPDLFFWKSKGAVFDIGFRYSPIGGKSSTLDMDINKLFARSDSLTTTENDSTPGDKVRDTIGLPEEARREKYYVPIHKFASDNELRWQYNFEIKKKGACEDVPNNNLRGSIDADSTIDMSSLPHFSYLPDLKLFANGAFPFSKYADLSQTVAVLPNGVDDAELTAYLNVMAHIGDATGYPATRLRVADSSSVKSVGSNADIIIFGKPGNQPLLTEWAEHMPLVMNGEGTKLQVLGAVERMRARFEGRDLDGAREHASRMIFEAGGTLSSIMSFESPLSSDRTVVAFVSPDNEKLVEMSRVIGDSTRKQFVGGDLTMLNTGKVSSYDMAPQYSVGKLPFFMGVRWWFAKQPLILAVIAVICAALLALVVYRLLRSVATRRKAAK